jgi:hypothetical protein
MTTIAYNHKDKQIAYDSRETAGDEIKSDSVIKMKEKDGVFYFFSGSVHCESDFINSSKIRGFKPETPIECSALIVRDGKVFKGNYSDSIGYWEIELNYSDSIGSGGVYALCAMDFGCDAKESVEYAKRRDCYTGGEVHVFNVDSPRS